MSEEQYEPEQPALGEETDGEEAPADPLEAFDAETRVQVEALIEAREAAARDDAEHRFRSAMGKYGRLHQQLAAQGQVVGEDGTAGVADPARFAEFAGQYMAQQEAAPAAAEPAEDPLEINDWDTPAEISSKTRLLVQRETQKQIDAMKAAMEAQQQQFAAAITQTQFPTAVERVRPFLTTLGQAHLADAPAFRQAMEHSLRGVPTSDWTEINLQTAAGMALAYAMQQGQAQAQERSPYPTQADRVQATQAARTTAREQANQGGVGMIQPSRGGRAPEQAAQDTETTFFLQEARRLGIEGSDEELLAAMDRPQRNGDGRTAYSRLLDEREKKARR